MDLIAILCVLVTCVTLLLLYLVKDFGYWSKRDIRALRPLPLLGNMLSVFRFEKQIGEFFSDVYRQHPGEDYVGIWVFGRPALVVRSPETIRMILVKDFHQFRDRAVHSDSEHDALGCNNLFTIKNPQWKWMRAKLSPLFTGTKMKGMFDLINKTGYDLVSYCSIQLDQGEDCIEVKELTAKYTTDTIASVAYGVKANSFTDPEALFRNLGRKIFEFKIWRAVEFSSMFFAPDLAKIMHFKFFSKQCSEILRNVFWSVIYEREANPVERNDLINTLISLKNEKPDEDNPIKFEGDTLVAQAAVFFTGGFETTGTTMSFTLYEITMNPSIQEKLYAEIKQILEKHEGNITFESVSEMKYLDMCLRETLRKYPSLPFLDRRCMGKYNLPNKKGVSIDDGVVVYIPMMGLHMDPEYFPDPEKYDPERFSEENVKNIKPYTYMPFGIGPRNCIGERFGILQTKVGLVHLLLNYQTLKSSKTNEKVCINPKALLLASKDGIYLTLKRRTCSTN